MNIINAAYEIGLSMCRDDVGFHFTVQLKSGRTIQGCPADSSIHPVGHPILQMEDCTLIPLENIEFIRVVQV